MMNDAPGTSRGTGGLQTLAPQSTEPLDELDAGQASGSASPAFRTWLLFPRLAAGSCPVTELDALALAYAGVTHVLDLRQREAGPDQPATPAAAELARRGIERKGVATAEGATPSLATFTALADWIDRVLDLRESMLFVHGTTGLERTAVLVTAWVARREGVSYAEAEHRLAAAGYPGKAQPAQREAAEAWLRSDAGRARRVADDWWESFPT